MDGNGFDRLTRGLAEPRPRRMVLAALAAGALGLGPPTASRSRRRRCNRAGRRCASGTGCCRTEECVRDASQVLRCCPARRTYVRCPDGCQCQGTDPAGYCCTEYAFQGTTCAEAAEPFCCPKAMACGTECCDPAKQACVNGRCECLPGRACGDTCCGDPDVYFCDRRTRQCRCFDPEDPRCPGGSGSTIRVRRYP